MKKLLEIIVLGLLWCSISFAENTKINEVQEEEINEELESLTNEEIPIPKRKGFFDKWVENLKDFLDNAE